MSGTRFYKQKCRTLWAALRRPASKWKLLPEPRAGNSQLRETHQPHSVKDGSTAEDLILGTAPRTDKSRLIIVTNLETLELNSKISADEDLSTKVTSALLLVCSLQHRHGSLHYF
jgi:hypothetical protein